MNTTYKFFSVVFLFSMFISCSEDSTDQTESNEVLEPLEVATVQNLFAPQSGGQGQGEIGGEFTKFSFESGAITTSETEWDIAFRGTTIAINGGVSTGTNDEPARNGLAGAALVTGIFDEVNSAEGLQFAQDA